jgi:flagellar assembly protein FliH
MKKRIIKNGFISDDKAVKVSNGNSASPQKKQNKNEDSIENSKISLSEKEEEILKSAEKKYESIINAGKKEADRIYEEQKELGFTKGYEEGKKAGLEEINSEKDNILKDVNSIKNNAQKKYREILKDSEKDILDMVMRISNKLIYDKLHDDKYKVLEIIKKTVEETTHKKNINLYVSSADFNTVTNKREKLLYEIDGIETLEIFHDENLSAGSCRIETSCGIIESDLKDRIEGLEKAFFELVEGVSGS